MKSPQLSVLGPQRRVLILSASVGAGHMRAATALEQAFLEIGAHEVQHFDTLEYAATLCRALYSKGYSYAARRLPTMTGWLYDAFDQPWRDAPPTFGVRSPQHTAICDHVAKL